MMSVRAILILLLARLAGALFDLLAYHDAGANNSGHVQGCDQSDRGTAAFDHQSEVFLEELGEEVFHDS